MPYIFTITGVLVLIVLLVAAVPQKADTVEILRVLTPQEPYLELPEIKPEPIYISYPSPPSWVTQKYISFLIQECSKHKVPYLLVFKLIERESEWKMNARNHNIDPVTGKIKSTDYGRFQINSKNISDFVARYRSPDRSVSSYDIIHNQFDNAEIGIKHLADLYSIFGNWSQAVQAYNCGTYRVQTRGPPESTVRYQQYIVPVEGWWDFPPEVVVHREG
jgi:hypothetical protein